jgi:UDP-glucose 4-epimerase
MHIEGRVFLVTGGAGFIGSHLIEYLLLNGARKVIALDYLRYGTWENLNVSVSRLNERLHLITSDFSEMTDAELSQRLQGVDYLYHLAAEKHNQSVDSPERVLAVNVNGTYRLLRAAAKAQVQKVIFTSSLYAYGRMHLPAMVETDIPKPHTVYGVSKLAGENLLHHLYCQYQLRYTVLRLFFTYGARQFAGMGYKSVIVKNFERMLAGMPPIIIGDGQQALDYIYVDDVVRALALSLDSQADQEVLNIGSGQAVTVQALTEQMLLVTESGLNPVFELPDWTAGSCRVSDNRKVKQILQWEPKISLQAGLSEVHRWMQAQPLG